MHPDTMYKAPSRGQGQGTWGRDLRSTLETEIIGHPLLAYELVDSTNDALKALATSGAPEGLTVIAEAQQNGRGRKGNKWMSTKDLGVYLSSLLKPTWPSQDVGWLAILAGVATATALEEVGLKDIHLEWPNDIFCKGRKIGGVLVEPRLGKKGIDFAVMGIGVNVAHTESDFGEELRDIATSCKIEGLHVSCREVASAVIHQLDFWYNGLDEAKRLALLQAWIDRGGVEQIPEVHELH